MNYESKMSETIPVFTIVVPLTHSLDDIDRCLSSLEEIDYPKENFQVVLVDCLVIPGLQEIIEKKVAEYRLQVRTIRLPEKAVNGHSWLVEARINEARNYAIQKIPSQNYVFTSDDCTFRHDWLKNFEAAMDEKVGGLGGPDILPEGLGWYPRAVDYILNSYLGNAGTRRGDKLRPDEYYPRKENMAIPAWVFERLGYFDEELMFGAELNITNRIRDAGYEIKFLSDNPVWHRRVTTFPNHVRIKANMTLEKVHITRRKGTFSRSLYFLIFLATLMTILIGLLSIVNVHARIVLAVLSIFYSAALLTVVVSSAIHTRSFSVGLGVLLLMPLHHLIIAYGTVKGVFTRLNF
jgi:glycosyltransferase involved in cell wall biosynthesis